MDENPDQPLPPPVVVGHGAAPRSTSLPWSLPATTIGLLGLTALTALTFAVDGLGHGALAVLAPLGDSTPAAPRASHYVGTLALGCVAGLGVATAGSVLWDGRASRAPAAVRGLVVGAAASTVAAVVVALGLGLL
ncbi:hypothetical protein GCM10009623_31270 [Nocardioides aestuarii]|uniref:Uncharacterized protein n=1 Tax=Nocardioides aestuarii TaxID=252231 RepID=A0ABW4TNP7_9ACTN